jgi:hypothetical protein
MAVLITKCPHCRASEMTFTVLSAKLQTAYKCSVFCSCNGCDEVIAATFQSSEHISRTDQITGFNGNLRGGSSFHSWKIWPEAEGISVPDGVPDKVGRSYVEAIKARRMQLWNPACGTYRRCMELALKAFAPDVDAWKLEKRIDKLAADNLITPALQEWAHELRLDGNEALHGEEDATQEMAEQMHYLTHFLLVYLYTLPEQIKNVRQRREDGN